MESEGLPSSPLQVCPGRPMPWVCGQKHVRNVLSALCILGVSVLAVRIPRSANILLLGRVGKVQPHTFRLKGRARLLGAV